MSDATPRMSRESFELLIERAVALDAAKSDAVPVAQAEAIAMELGISESAWTVALAERAASVTPARGRPASRVARFFMAGGLGLAAGALAGAASAALNSADVGVAAALVAAAVGWIIQRTVARTESATQRELAGWWIGVPVGIMLGMHQWLGDPVWFAAFSWAGCAAFATLLRTAMRRRDATNTKHPQPSIGGSIY
ncbi:MAG: hypothetical protein V4617_12330 [Gemmatimonadota bacterium]